MKLIKYVVIFLLIFSSALHAQEITKEEKRAERKQIRLYLKHAVTFYENQKLDSAYIFIDSLLQISPKNVDAYFYKGLIELKNGDTTKADTTLTEGMSANPLSTRIKLLLSRVKIEQQDFQTASELLEAILKIKPNEPETLYLRGLTSLYQNDTTTALDYLQHSLESALKRGK